MAKPKLSKNLNDNLKRLSEITNWFDKQKEVDVEAGLKKVKEAAQLIKTSKERLKEIENEFKEIKKEIEPDEEIDNDGKKEGDEDDKPGEGEVGVEDIPF